MFQKSVNRLQAFGVAGELYADKHTQTYVYTLNESSDNTMPTFGRAFTQTVGTVINNPTSGVTNPEQRVSATMGGDDTFAGILVFPKEHALYGGLEPSNTIPSGSEGSLCTFGQIVVKVASAVQVGQAAGFIPETGEIVAKGTAGANDIPNSKFILVNSDNGGLAVLQLG